MPANDNKPPELGLHPDFGDIEIMLNMRNWLQKSLEISGGEVCGAGLGMGQAHVEIKLEGFMFDVTIKPWVIK